MTAFIMFFVHHCFIWILQMLFIFIHGTCSFRGLDTCLVLVIVKCSSLQLHTFTLQKCILEYQFTIHFIWWLKYSIMWATCSWAGFDVLISGSLYMHGSRLPAIKASYRLMDPLLIYMSCAAFGPYTPGHPPLCQWTYA